MVEIETIETPKRKESATSTATDKTTETTPSKGSSEKQIEECTKHQGSDGSVLTDKINPGELEIGDIFYGSAAHQNKNNQNTKTQGIFKVISVERVGKHKSKCFTLKDICGNEFKSNQGGIKITNIKDEQKKKQIEEKATNAFDKKEETNKEQEKATEKATEKTTKKAIAFSFNSLTAEQKLNKLISSGQNNIWMVGPAGCGKSTMARNVAKELNIPYLCISCGIGTSATEFVGYKYPTREATKFAEYYAKKSIILIDEMTALDPAVAQVLNAALANDEIETTTGLVHRNPECIIIATSNTFGNGADRQYVANNQLDSSTIDRFVGGIIEVDYSKEYESQFDKEVVTYANHLRRIIKENSLRRIASTRMIQAAHRMKNIGIADWKDLIIINWSDSEKQIVHQEMRQKMYRTAA